MEARVWSGTGLLPENLQTIRLTTLADGRWQASGEFAVGDAWTLQIPAGAGAQAQMVGALRSQLGFTSMGAAETARRLFEPFEMAENWPW